MKRIVAIAFMLYLCLHASGAGAHCIWLNIDNDEPKKGEPIRIEIGWGHKFPKDTVIEDKSLNHVYALGPKGMRITLKQKGPNLFDFFPPEAGSYTVCADIHPGFLSKTTEGYKLQSKKGLDHAVSCFRYDIRAKAFVTVRNKSKTPFQAVGDPLEVLPQKDPGLSGKGDDLPVKIVFNGRPLCNADVHATYAGFSDRPNTFALTVKTDDQGVALIKILEKGAWLINVVHEVPYPDGEECDKYRYNASFTFNIR